MYGDFFLIERDDAPPQRAERLAFGDTQGRNEAWLRDTLFAQPDILPIADIDTAFGPLIPLCTELRTAAGPIDLAFINPYGRLTLVECKLWRNPEARRKVVAQTLDYARAVVRWSYADLQRQVSAARKQQGNCPYELVRERFPDVSEQRFVDATAEALRSGRFLLLIAGDGIRSDVSSITELVNRNATHGFAFGLVEVALYGLEDGGTFIQPRVLARTEIVERVVVIAKNIDSGQLTLEEDTATAPNAFDPDEPGPANPLGESSRQAEYRRWWQPVIDHGFDDPEQEPAVLCWPNHVRAYLPWPGTWVTAYRFGGANGGIGVSTSGRLGEDSRLIETLGEQRAEIQERLPKGTELKTNSSGTGKHYVTVRRYDDFIDDDERATWAADVLNQYVNVFRPLSRRAYDNR